MALSALETHGTVGCLLAGESGLPIKDILEVAQVAHVRAVFARLLGEEVLRRFEATGEADEAEAAPSAEVDGAEAAPSAEAEAAGTTSALRAAAGPAKASSTTSGTQQQESAVGPKRKARMAMVDELRAEEEKKPKKSKSGGDALILD